MRESALATAALQTSPPSKQCSAPTEPLNSTKESHSLLPAPMRDGLGHAHLQRDFHLTALFRMAPKQLTTLELGHLQERAPQDKGEGS